MKTAFSVVIGQVRKCKGNAAFSGIRNLFWLEMPQTTSDYKNNNNNNNILATFFVYDSNPRGKFVGAKDLI